MSTVITQERRNSDDRRMMIATPLFPFFDSEDTLVRQDRRQIPERRLNNITIQESTIKEAHSSAQEELGNKRLFIWFQDEIHEIKRADKNIWIGRSSDCLATFNSRFVSRQHARLYFEDGAYYLADESINGTYIQNDDGETFVTKGKVLVKGSGVISLGVPIDHSESDLIHFFIG